MPFPHFWEYFLEKSIVDFKYGQLDKRNATYSAYNPQKCWSVFSNEIIWNLQSWFLVWNILKSEVSEEKSTEVLN